MISAEYSMMLLASRIQKPSNPYFLTRVGIRGVGGFYDGAQGGTRTRTPFSDQGF